MGWSTFTWRDYPLQVKTRVAVLVPILALLLSCSFIGWLSARQANAQGWVTHTIEVRMALEQLEHQFGSVDLGLKAYLDSDGGGKPVAVRDSLAALRQTLSKIHKLTWDNPGQVRRASELDSLLGKYTELAQGTVAASQKTGSLRKDDLGKKIRDKIDAMDEEEIRLWGLRATRAGDLKTLSLFVIAGSMLIGVVGGFIATSLLSSNICRRISQLLESFTLVASGLQVKTVDKSRDELGQLAAGLAQASRVLSERASEITELNWKLESVLRAATEVAIIAEDDQGRITIFNSGAAKLLGYRTEEVMGRKLATVLHGESNTSSDSLRGLKLARERALENITREYETTYVRKDEIRLHVQVSVTALKNVSGKIVGLLHVAQDITPRKLLETELRKKMEELRLQNRAVIMSEAHAGSAAGAVESQAADQPVSNILPEMLKPIGSGGGERLSSILDSINNWYEQNGQIPDPNTNATQQLPKILIVDDFEDTRFLLRAYLQSEPYDLNFASNGEEALVKVSEHHYDLILMDVEMPKMDGYETASRIRTWEQAEGRPRIPIVALSAHDQANSPTTDRAVWTSYLLKPLSKSQLLSEVETHIKLYART